MAVVSFPALLQSMTGGERRWKPARPMGMIGSRITLESSMRKLFTAALAATVLVLAACSSTGSREYIEPEGPIADDCISSCKAVRTRCRAQAQDMYKRCRQEYDYRRQQHDYCVAQGGSWCIAPEPCRPSRTQHCQDQYDGCFQQCGGIITEPVDA